MFFFLLGFLDGLIKFLSLIQINTITQKIAPKLIKTYKLKWFLINLPKSVSLTFALETVEWEKDEDQRETKKKKSNLYFPASLSPVSAIKYRPLDESKRALGGGREREVEIILLITTEIN